VNLSEFIKEILPTLMKFGISKLEADIEEGHVSAYWAGTIIRIDLKPLDRKVG
jgi:hypothetical protein